MEITRTMGKQMTFKEYCLMKWNYNGLSAMCIFKTWNLETTEHYYPHDPYDLCRCIQVLKKLFGDIERCKIEALHIIATRHKSPQYRALANNWLKLNCIFHSEWGTNCAENTLEYMNKIYSEITNNED
jgi:hypothetical protein